MDTTPLEPQWDDVTNECTLNMMGTLVGHRDAQPVEAVGDGYRLRKVRARIDPQSYAPDVFCRGLIEAVETDVLILEKKIR